MTEKKSKSNLEFTVTQDGQVVNAAGILVKNNPMPSSGRKWIKVWVDPWLDGTTRWVVSGSQRAFWVDLCCLAGRSRFPGFVCPGQENGQLIGYPLYWYQNLQPDIDVMATLKLFESTGKIRLIITSENPLLIAIEILKWKIYQSDLDSGAQRARKYRESKKKAR
jgi:hypothetical protein